MSPEQQEIIKRELKVSENLRHQTEDVNGEEPFKVNGLYDYNDQDIFLSLQNDDYSVKLFTIDELLERDKQREEDGFPRRIKLGKFIKAIKDNKEKIVVVPSTRNNFV